MKLHSLVIRMIFAWVPILPPPVIIGQPQRTGTSRPASSPCDGVTTEGRQGIKVSMIESRISDRRAKLGG